MFRLFSITLLLLSTQANAGLYIDLSAEVHNKYNDSFIQNDGTPIENIIGSVELGWEFDIKPISIFIRHSSSMQQEDTGLNSIGVKVRIQ